MIDGNKVHQSTSCPVCAEQISSRAVRCKHCRSIQSNYADVNGRLIEYCAIDAFCFFSAVAFPAMNFFLDYFELVDDDNMSMFVVFMTYGLTGLFVLNRLRESPINNSIFKTKYSHEVALTHLLNIEDKKYRIANTFFWIVLGVLLNWFVFAIKDKRPTHEEFLQYLATQTDFIEDDIIDKREHPYYLKYTLIDDLDEEVYLYGIWNDFGEIKSPKRKQKK